MDRQKKIDELNERWRVANARLDDLAAGKVDPSPDFDPAVREQELLGELDAIEYEMGMLGEPEPE